MKVFNRDKKREVRSLIGNVPAAAKRKGLWWQLKQIWRVFKWKEPKELRKR